MPTCSAPRAVRDIKGGKTVVVGNSRFDIVTEAALKAEFGDAAPDAEGRKAYMAGLTFRTVSLAKVARALQEGKIDGRGARRGSRGRAGQAGAQRRAGVHRIDQGWAPLGSGEKGSWNITIASPRAMRARGRNS